MAVITSRTNRINQSSEPTSVAVIWLWGVRLLCLPLLLISALSLPAWAHEGLYEQLVAVTQQIRKAPRNPQLYLKRGELYRLLQQWDNALDDYRRARQLKPDMLETDFYCGRMWFEAGEPQRAKPALDAFLKNTPQHGEALLMRARVYEKLKDYRASAADYSHALSSMLGPKPDYFIERAKVQLADGKHADALRGLDEAIKQFGPLVTLQTQAIEIELQQAHWDSALARLDRLTSPAPRKESYLARRGEILLQAGRAAEARAAFSESLQSIEALPIRLRQTRAMLALEKRVRAALR